MKYIWLTCLTAFTLSSASAQVLQPGFQPDEFAEILKINAQLSDIPENLKFIPAPAYSKKVYDSEVVGLKNKWQLWLSHNNVAVITLRGSTLDLESWLANFFAAQIPAQGTLHISTDRIWDYKLATHPQAAVHAGYVFSTLFLLQDIIPVIDSFYKVGIRDFIVTGHSQGGGLTYMVSASLLQLQKQGQLPSDIRFKVYTSASPKPGNLYFAYDYENLVGAGWSHHIVSMEDWVPQTPFTVQTIEDLPTVNPLVLYNKLLDQQSFIKRIFINRIYKRITDPSIKSVERYQKYLGEIISKQIQKHYPEFIIPEFAHSNEYVRTGHQVVLAPQDSAYYKEFDIHQDTTKFMLHHSTVAYYYLLAQQYRLGEDITKTINHE